jgi:hypothetical protein
MSAIEKLYPEELPYIEITAHDEVPTHIQTELRGMFAEYVIEGENGHASLPVHLNEAVHTVTFTPEVGVGAEHTLKFEVDEDTPVRGLRAWLYRRITSDRAAKVMKDLSPLGPSKETIYWPPYRHRRERQPGERAAQGLVRRARYQENVRRRWGY